MIKISVLKVIQSFANSMQVISLEFGAYLLLSVTKYQIGFFCVLIYYFSKYHCAFSTKLVIEQPLSKETFSPHRNINYTVKIHGLLLKISSKQFTIDWLVLCIQNIVMDMQILPDVNGMLIHKCKPGHIWIVAWFFYS